MSFFRRITNTLRREPWLWGLLAATFLLRLAGVGYGLPLTVIADEPPFTLGALQMIQLHTLVPSLHAEAFKTILPYPPYISYALIIPFIVILSFKFLLYHGSAILFQAMLLSDLSAFFITARLVSIFFSVISVWLVYRITMQWFRSPFIALAAGFLLSTSLLSEGLAMVGRNWTPVSMILLLVLFALTHETWSVRRRYCAAFVISGIGMGVSPFCAFGTIIAGLYYLFFDARSSKEFVKQLPFFIGSGIFFLLLAIIPTILWHSGYAFLDSVTITQHKTLTGLLLSPWEALSKIIYSEPVLVVLALGGLIFLLQRHRRIASFVICALLAYIAIFYFFFRFDPRFLLPLIPLLALAGGYCIDRLWSKQLAVFLCVLLAIPLISSIRLSSLAFNGDTRAHAREWAEQNLKPSDKVIVFGAALYLPTPAIAVKELRSIDAGAVRKTYEAYESLDRHDIPYALNLSTLGGDNSFFLSLSRYAHQNGYEYMILDPQYALQTATTTRAFTALTAGATEVARFNGRGTTMSLENSSFTEPFFKLFTQRSLGPDIVVYKFQ